MPVFHILRGKISYISLMKAISPRLLRRGLALAAGLAWMAAACAQLSLEAAEAQSKQPAGVRQLQALNFLAEHYASSSSGRTIYYAERAISRADALQAELQLSPKDDPDFSLPGILRCKADALNLLGRAYEQQGEARKALRSYRDAQGVAAALGYPEAEARAAEGMARSKGEASPSRLIQSAAEKIEKVGEWVEGKVAPPPPASNTTAVLENAAREAEAAGKYPQAIEYYEQALSLPAVARDSAHCQLLYVELARLHGLAGNASRRAHYEQLAGIAPPPGANRGSSPQPPPSTLAEAVKNELQIEAEYQSRRDAYLRESETLARQGRYRESLELLRKSSELERVIGELEKARELDSLLLRQSEQEKLVASEKLARTTQGAIFLGLALLLALVIALLAFRLLALRRRSLRQVAEAYDALNVAHEQLKSAQTQLVTSEKMASLGQLTAGIAHEINNPVNFISGNISPLRENISELAEVLEAYRQAALSPSPALLERAEALRRQVNLDLVRSEIGELLNGMEEGASRTAEIVRGLRTFARLDEDARKPVDLHLGLDSTLALLKGRLRQIEVLKDYGEIPEVEGYPGKLNQVFMNILDNAIQAMPGGGIVYIQTHLKEGCVEIRIRDTGNGMSEEVRRRIFEPFFTTKSVGEGTGLGLPISLGIVMQHQGNIEVHSQPGQGTEVIIRIPARQVPAPLPS
jgi:signal transduction histidine kinase